MKFVCVVFELCDKMLTLSSMENLIVPCNRKQTNASFKRQNDVTSSNAMTVVSSTT